MAIKTSQSINGFIASDPQVTVKDGQARFYARIGINHYRRDPNGTFVALEPTYHDLVQFGRGAELSAERFRKGDKFVAQGRVRDYTRELDGERRTDQQFVTSRLAHDPNITTYHVDRRPRSEREAPTDGREIAAHSNGSSVKRPLAAVESDGLGF